MLCGRIAKELSNRKISHGKANDSIRRSLTIVRIPSLRDGHSTSLSNLSCHVDLFSPLRNHFGVKTHHANFTSNVQRPERRSFIPKKAPIELTETARKFFLELIELETSPESDPSHTIKGIVLRYEQSSTGEPRMVFSFNFIREKEITTQDYETVSLEVMEDGSPKPPALSMMDDKPKLYIHKNAFMKVLGAKLDVSMDEYKIVLYDRNGDVLDPNA